MSHINMKIQNFEKGVSLYLALIIMAILLAIGLGISTIIISQMKMIEGMGDSVVAFHAADTGIERALYDGDTPSDHYPQTNINSSSYEVWVVCCQSGIPPCAWSPPATECPSGLTEYSTCTASYFCYKSVGTYRGIKRAIEATR